MYVYDKMNLAFYLQLYHSLKSDSLFDSLNKLIDKTVSVVLFLKRSFVHLYRVSLCGI